VCPRARPLRLAAPPASGCPARPCCGATCPSSAPCCSRATLRSRPCSGCGSPWRAAVRHGGLLLQAGGEVCAGGARGRALPPGEGCRGTRGTAPVGLPGVTHRAVPASQSACRLAPLSVPVGLGPSRSLVPPHGSHPKLRRTHASAAASDAAPTHRPVARRDLRPLQCTRRCHTRAPPPRSSSSRARGTRSLRQ